MNPKSFTDPCHGFTRTCFAIALTLVLAPFQSASLEAQESVHEDTRWATVSAPSSLSDGTEAAPSPEIRSAKGPLIEEGYDEVVPEAWIGTSTFRSRFREDLSSFPEELWQDTKSLVSLPFAVVVGTGGGLAAVSRGSWDDSVREDTLAHARRWGGANNVLDAVGHPATHFGAVGILYAGSFLFQDQELHDFSAAALSTLFLTNGTVVGLKYAFDTERPDGSAQGFPSGHTASSFALAAVVEEYHGPLAGLGAYTVAGLVGWSRIDNRKHDLSDVLFGAAFGYAVGKCVARRHRRQDDPWTILPFAVPSERTVGLWVEREF